MIDTLTIVGKVATDPIQSQTAGGIPVTNFRLASTHRRFDNATQAWVDAGTNWYSVAAFRQLGEHAKASLRTGDSVIVTGRLRIRNWEAGGKHGTSVDIDADAIGHDLRWGTTAYLRASRASAPEQARTAVGGGEVDAAPDAVDERPLDTSWAVQTDAVEEVEQAETVPF
ncbi:single-stranded DNA-binding protein [Microbacterium sp. HM58-2]|nr:single-stranded DNA-binding protein [Microbacterium sp. HM58-2]